MPSSRTAQIRCAAVARARLWQVQEAAVWIAANRVVASSLFGWGTEEDDR
jgi:hypothetical protein